MTHRTPALAAGALGLALLAACGAPTPTPTLPIGAAGATRQAVGTQVVAPTVQAAGTAAAPTVQAAQTQVLGTAQAAGTPVAPTAQAAQTQVAGAAQGAATQAVGTVQAAQTAVPATVQAVGTALAPTVQAAGTAVAPTVQAAQTQVPATVQAAQTQVAPTVQALQTQVAPTAQAVQTQVAATVVPPIATSVASSPIKIDAIQGSGPAAVLTLRNDGATPVNVSRWALLVGHDVVLLPVDRQLSVPPGKTLSVHFGNGTDTETDVYLRRVITTGTDPAAVKPGDRVVLVTPVGQVASIYTVT